MPDASGRRWDMNTCIRWQLATSDSEDQCMALVHGVFFNLSSLQRKNVSHIITKDLWTRKMEYDAIQTEIIWDL